MDVRIILDDCAIRNHIHGDQLTLDVSAVQASPEALKLSIAGPAFAELTEQLARWSLSSMQSKPQGLSFIDWTNRIHQLDVILDQQWPCFPNGKELAVLAGTRADPSVNLDATQRHIQACWRLLRDSNSLSDLEAGTTYQGSNGEVMGINFSVPQLQKVMSEERNSWIDYIEKMRLLLPGLGINSTDEVAILALMKSNLGSSPGDPPDLAIKLDTVARMITNLLSLSLKNKDSYNPSADKRRGDTFDINLLFCVPLPAVICTADRKFVNRLRGTSSPHARQVVTIDEFNKHVIDGTVKSLVT